MAASNKPERNKRLNTNAAKIMKTPKITNTKVNTQARTNEVETFKAERPRGGEINRDSMIAWAATNPNRKSNAARRLAKSRTPKPKKP